MSMPGDMAWGAIEYNGNVFCGAPSYCTTRRPGFVVDVLIQRVGDV